MSLLEAYCNRLDLPIPNDPISLEFLQQLHIKHCFTIPFENLGIRLGVFPLLEKEALMDKILLKKYGGYCFELNGLFYALLKELGFEVYCLCGRILFGRVTIGYRSHQLLWVHLDEQSYVIDVGYRNGVIMPIPLVFDTVFPQYSESYRLLEKGEKHVFQKEVFLQKKILGNWEDMYSFFLTPYEPVDFQPLNICTATLADSTFTTKRIMSLKTPTGSKSLLDNVFVEMINGNKQERFVQTAREYQMILEKEFGIFLKKQDCERLFKM